MNAVAEVVPSKGTDIVAIVEATPVIVLTDKKKFSEFYEAMREECDAHVPDLTTEKGRKAIASLAYKVARTKTAIDDAGKKLNEEARAGINAVDEARRKIRQQLDDLKDEVRRPLTEWEKAEFEREAMAAAEMQSIRDASWVDFSDTAEDVAARIANLEALTIDDALHGDTAGIARAALADAVSSLRAAHERLVREEQERAELERLRAEAAARQRIEAERAAEAEAARLREQAEKAEAERRAAAEKAEQVRIETAKREAEERARQEAERKAQEERDAADRAHAEALAAERRRAEEAEAAAQAERDRAAQVEAERKATAEREAAEQARRNADRAHRGEVMRAARDAIMEAGPVNEAAAKAIVLAIAANNVPHISIQF